MKDIQEPSDTHYQGITATFCVVVVISNIISAKLFTLPFFDHFSIPAGLLTYPLTFILSDLVTEIYGAKKSKQMVYLALGLAILSDLIIEGALLLPSNDSLNAEAFQSVLGLNGIILFSSLIAYVLAQILDIQLYALIKNWTGDSHLWLRNNASTLISQIVDTVAVNLIFLYWGLGLDLQVVYRVMLFSYAYKAIFTIGNTPLFYLLVFLSKRSRTPSTSFWKQWIEKKRNKMTS